MPIETDHDVWFRNMVESVERDHDFVNCRDFRTVRGFMVYCKTTTSVWDDGVPVLKRFRRSDEMAVFIEDGAKFEIIETHGLASGTPLVYWLRGGIWHTASGYDAQELIDRSDLISNSNRELLEKFICGLSLFQKAAVMCGRDARSLVQEGEDEIYDILMNGFTQDPYSTWSTERLIDALVDRYDNGPDGLKQLKADLAEFC